MAQIKVKVTHVNPTTSFSADGKIIFTIDPTSPARPYQFRITKEGGTPTSWFPEDGIGSKKKEFSGLTPGRYLTEMAYDKTYATQECVESTYVVLEDPCTEGKQDPCKCGFSLHIDPALTQQLKFINKNNQGTGPFPHYQIGESDMTFEVWIKVDDDTKQLRLWEWTKDPLFPPTSLTDYRFAIQLNQHATGSGFTTVAGAVRIMILNSTSNDPQTVLQVPKYNSGVQTSLSDGNFHHLVCVWKKYTGAGVVLLSDTWKVFIDGVEYSIDQDNGESTRGSALNTGNVPVAEYNINNQVGDIRFAQHAASSTSTGVTITNHRLYSRELRLEEVQTNYLRGCAGEPSDCSGMLIYAPLNQKSGMIAQDVAHANHGVLFNGYTSTNTAINGGAWVYTCCPQIASFLDFGCCALECDKDYALASFTFNTAIKSTATPDSLVVVFGSDTCPTVAAYPTSATHFIWSPTVTVDDTANEQALSFVTAYNAAVVNPLYKPTGAYAVANLGNVTIKLPIDAKTETSEFCGKFFHVCTYANDITGPTGGSTNDITYPAGTVVVCCLNDGCCGEQTVVENDEVSVTI